MATNFFRETIDSTWSFMRSVFVLWFQLSVSTLHAKHMTLMVALVNSMTSVFITNKNNDRTKTIVLLLK